MQERLRRDQGSDDNRARHGTLKPVQSGELLDADLTERARWL